ncbi:hypothetical protein EGP99_05110 [bacterium]|nr:hypothetical protein [bacterium]
MKKSKIRVIIGVILSLIILVILVALIFNTSALIKNTNNKNNEYPKEKNNTIEIIDLTKNNSDISCLNEEEFYKDETYIYYLPCNSKYISVIYNEEKFDIKTALTNKIIKLTDLDKYNIKYIKKEISKEETNKIITISFDTKGGSKVDSISLDNNQTFRLPENPTYNGYIFKGWIDKNNNKITNETIFNEDTTLYAIWEKVDKKNNVVTEKPTNSNSVNNNQNNENTSKEPDKIDTPQEEPPKETEKTQAQKNNEYRNQIQNKYSIKIAYKDEMNYYSMNGYTRKIIEDDNEINKYLIEIDKALAKYPEGFFKEMKNFNMPATIYLVKSISGNVSGVTDAHIKTNIIIMIEPSLLFEYVLHHEIMHYIDSYISVKGYPIDINKSMNEVNPDGFIYGDESNDYVYNFTEVKNAYFVSKYGKTNYLEDRAVIFAELMFRTYTKDCYAKNTPINKKANFISSQIKEHFSILKSTEKYYWDRFIK